MEQRANDFMCIFGKNIHKRRIQKALSQQELADKLGIEQHSLSRIERGEMAPKFSRLPDLAKELDCTVAELFAGDTTSYRGRIETIASSIEGLSPEFQDIIVNLVVDTSATLDKISRKGE